MLRTRVACVALATALSGVPVAAQQNVPQQVFAGTGIGPAWMGTSVAGSESTIAVAAPATEFFETGHVLVHEKVGGAWVVVKDWMPAAIDSSSRFGEDLDIDGDILVAGAPGVPVGAGSYKGGRAFVLERIGGVWTETAVLVAPDPNPAYIFGKAVAVSGNRLLITHPGAGHAHIFEKVAGTWRAVAVLDPVTTDFFAGSAAALDGDRAVVGDSAGTGSAITFAFNGSTWNESQHLVSPAPNQQSGFAASLDLEGDLLAIGEPHGGPLAPGGLFGCGVVRLYRDVAGTWQPAGVLKEPGPPKLGEFGTSVDLDGSRLLVGAPTGGGNAVGRAQLFEDEGVGFAHVLEFHGPGSTVGAGFCYAAAFAGDTVVTGQMHIVGSYQILDLADDTWQDLGSSHAPATDSPAHLSGFGTLETGTMVTLVLDQASKGAPAVLFLSLAGPAPFPYKGGTLLATPVAVAVTVIIGSTGTLMLQGQLPPGLEGQNLVAQFVSKVSVSTFELSNAIVGHVP